MLQELKVDFERYSKKYFSVVIVMLYFLKNVGFRAVFLYRIGKLFKKKNIFFLPGICQRLMHHLCHCYISINSEIGPGFLIAHAGGIVIGAESTIGANCDIRQNVTLGGNYNKRSADGRTQPTIENNVSFGAGSVIIGPVIVGANSIIGANSVVTRDVPQNVIVFGIPAKIIRKRWSKDSDRKL